jgi:hypothetical protein
VNDWQNISVAGGHLFQHQLQRMIRVEMGQMERKGPYASQPHHFILKTP